MNKKSNLKSELSFAQKFSESAAKYMTTVFGSVTFLWFFIIFNFFWIFINTTYDPYPHHTLILVLHLFDVILTILILMSQNVEMKISDVRQQVDLEVNVRSEEAVKRVLIMMEDIHRHLGILQKDIDLKELKESVNLEEIKEVIEERLDGTDKLGEEK